MSNTITYKFEFVGFGRINEGAIFKQTREFSEFGEAVDHVCNMRSKEYALVKAENITQ